MSILDIDDVDRLKRINDALLNRVERAMDQQRNAFSLFQTAIALEGQVRRRTDELTSTLRNLERTNAELARQKEISERADQSKTRFLAAASHDVLQPLHAAQLTMSALHDLQENERGRAMVAQVERALDTMNELLHTLLDISRLDAGVMVPSLSAVPLTPVIDSLLSDLRPIAEAKGLRLQTAIAGDHVRSDRTMLRRALQNLISNAIRYTDRGGVLIGTRRRGDMVAIEVVDTGCGIPLDQRERIFDEFHRGSAAKERAGQDGDCALGLGLSIVRRLVTALGHELSLTSEVGKGSRFRILARRCEALQGADAPPSPAPRQARDAALSGRRILLVENDPDVIRAMSVLLEGWGCDHRAAACQGEALDILDQGFVPDLVIADQHLDHGDLGTRTVAVLLHRLGRRLPVILATADITETVMHQAEQLGAEFMAKPVKPAQLRALMAHMLARAP
ncbi:hybrid sensor histidine kinase/response regulator [Stappia sp. MMSF_3263]|uniref:ATP-binding response regulator n=1 Tax=Stappia sp. MMSF_3263 TaxID=3046693 RepID=UPI00273FC554|nr:hybrid sensor histidine kinase/response regulator [Stappia sp. MMSF_3263]